MSSSDTETPPEKAPDSWRKSKLLKYGLPCLVLIVLANHLEYHFRIQHFKNTRAPDVVVHAEDNLLTGHTTIGIDEKSRKTEKMSLVRFALLGEWNYDPKAPADAPAGIRELAGKDVSCVGFMYPLEPGTTIRSFCLLRTTQTCCYGPRPQYNQYLLVEMKQSVKFERMKPVIVEGTFFADPQPSQGYIYRIEGKSLIPVSDDGPDANPEDESRRSGIPLFDFNLLSGIEGSKTKDIPSGLLALDSRTIIAAGYFSNRTEEANPKVLVGSKYWDGSSKGSIPTIYNTVIAHFRDAGQLPPLWKEKGIVKGILKVERNPDLWRQNGIVSLHDAERLAGTGCHSGVNIGPILGIWAESLLVLCFLYLMVRRIISCKKQIANIKP